ncbi:MAG TPA: hypothetical protein VKP78_05455 [bacterium]|nr:hypothetical protein [bacterium]
MNVNRILSIVLITGLVIGNIAFSQNRIPIDDPRNKIAGLSLFQTYSGAGLGGFFEKNISPSNKIGAAVRLVVQRGENDYPITYYDPYYGSTYSLQRSDKRRISMLETYFNYKRLFFTDMIANNFRPYVQLNAGPVIAFDPPNVSEFKERINNISTAFTFGANINVGIDFLWEGNTSFSISFGYDFMKFNEKLDPPPTYYDREGNVVEDVETYTAKSDYSGMIAIIRFGKKF